MRDPNVDLFKKAKRLVGLQNLAVGLQTNPDIVEAWIEGDATIPYSKLVQLAEYLQRIARPSKS